MTMPYIPVIGTDCRLPYLAEALGDFGYTAPYYPEPTALSSRPDIMVLGLRPTPSLVKKLLPFADSGGLLCAGLPSKDLYQMAESHGFAIYDYMQDATVAIRNGAVTAEGALTLALTHSPITLQNAKVLILGYGRCGEPLATKCRLLGARVTLCEKAPTRRATAQSRGFVVLSKVQDLAPYDVVFNTVPYLMLTAEELASAHRDLHIFDLASSPGGTDFTYCEAHRIHAMLCPALPARFAPKSAGTILAETIHDYVRKSKRIS